MTTDVTRLDLERIEGDALVDQDAPLARDVLELVARVRELEGQSQLIDIVFAGEHSPPGLTFVEVEDAATGAGMRLGEWIERDGYKCLRFQALAPEAALDVGLRAALVWAMETLNEELGFDDSTGDEAETPKHHCGYVHAPDTGHCRFHDMYWTASALVQPHATPAHPEGTEGA